MTEAANLEILTVLRSAIKTKGLSYKQVAEKIGVSEQTIKRLFRDKDCSITRLSHICEAIDISIYDLIEFSKHYTEPHVELTNEQEEFLSEHPHHFAFLFFLTTNHSVEEIKNAYGLSDLSIFKYLKDLDDQGFIELREGNNFRLLVQGKLLMRLHGSMHDIVKSVNTLFLNYVIDHDGDNGTSFDSSFRFMSQETYLMLKSELGELNKKYRKLANQNESILTKEKLIPVKWSTISSPFDICGKWPLKDPYRESIQGETKPLFREEKPEYYPRIAGQRGRSKSR